jgi:hypothetical protein
VFISGHLINDWAAKVGANQASHALPEEHYVYAFPYWDALSSEDVADRRRLQEIGKLIRRNSPVQQPQRKQRLL